MTLSTFGAPGVFGRDVCLQRFSVVRATPPVYCSSAFSLHPLIRACRCFGGVAQSCYSVFGFSGACSTLSVLVYRVCHFVSWLPLAYQSPNVFRCYLLLSWFIRDLVRCCLLLLPRCSCGPVGTLQQASGTLLPIAPAPVLLWPGWHPAAFSSSAWLGRSGSLSRSAKT